MSTEDIGGGMTSADVEAWRAANPEAKATQPAKSVEDGKTLDTMPGNILLAAVGAKTLYVGYPKKETPKAGDIVWLTSTTKISADGASRTIKVPVTVDQVGGNAPRAALNAEDLIAAGYRDDTNLVLRLKGSPHYLQRAVDRAATSDHLSQAEVDDMFLKTAPASRIRFHLSTPDELKANGYSVREAHNEITNAFASLKLSADLGRPSITDAIAFAKEQGVDLTKAKLSVQSAFSNAGAVRAA